MVSLSIIIVHVFMGYCTCSANLFKQQIIILFSIFVFLLITEYYNKLKAKVAEIMEEKRQLEEKKQIITG